ncbi:MAG: tetratricopeptide repeat protein [Eubacterium sp.]
MDINAFLNKLDKLYEEKRINDVEPFFNESFSQAVEKKDLSSQFTILNEMMGFFRDTSQYDKSIKACHQCIDLMKNMGIEGTVSYATSLQNIANAHRAAGLLKESLDYYNQTFQIYENNIPSGDYRFASLNNNIALLYQEMGHFEKAVEYLKKALSIIEKIEGAEIEVATTYSNLAASLLELGQTDQAIAYLEKALDIYRKDEVKNFHYSAALSAMAAAQCKLGNYKEAVPLYEEALKEIETNMGRGTAYQITEENLNKVYKELGSQQKEVPAYLQKVDNCEVESDGSKLTGMQLAAKFYEEYGAPMIHEKFPEYEDQIAVGFVGEGSERFGFDDEYSMDHDFGPGFCMWVTKTVYAEIGEQLQKEYDKLPLTYMGVTRVTTEMAQGRVGVQSIGDFYEKYTGYRQSPDTVGKWIELEDYRLATVTNGAVFRDDLGIFTDIRNHFMNQPERARLVKLAREISAMAQTGQCNYGRSMARGDYVTAQICISEFMQHTMKCVYILNKKYAPYYKWMLQGIKKLDRLSQVGNLLEQLAELPDQRNSWRDYSYDNTQMNKNDQKALMIEKIAGLIIHALYDQQMISDTESNFLNDYVSVIMAKASSKDTDCNKLDKSGYRIMEQTEFKRDEIIDEIVKLEFEAFDKVQNVGGRAECQNNWPFFYVMRKSQYMTWTDEMLECIRNLWQQNKHKGWNMITEKYGRMMEYTAPEEYEQIKDNFPEKSERTIAIVNQIAQIQVGWMQDFAGQYPKLAANARDITSDADELDNTSYETYLKGELLTYSDELLKMYARFIVGLAREGKNLAQMTIENTAHLQGYKSLDEAEQNI